MSDSLTISGAVILITYVLLHREETENRSCKNLMSCLRDVGRDRRRAGETAKQQEQPEVKTKTRAKERIVIEKRVCFDYVTSKAEDERKREKEIKLKKELEKTTTTTLAFNLKSCSQHKTFNEQERARREADPVTYRV